MMTFYKENKVNPFASCLPLLLQLPVFLALFSAAERERVQGPGAGHRRRTASSSSTNITEPAHGAELVILMVLFIGSQMASTLVMSATADKTQQRIMLLLPLVFAALIPNFPAGLIVYWITTNFWTLGQQLVVRRLSPPPAVAVAGGAPAAALVRRTSGTKAPATSRRRREARPAKRRRASAEEEAPPALRWTER